MDRKQVVLPGRRERRRHSPEFKRQVIEACLQPGVSIAAVALANGLNANFVRQWVKVHRERALAGQAEETCLAVRGPVTRVPVTLAAEPGPGLPPLEIRLDVRCGGTTVQMAWPVEAAGSLGQCLRELLR